MNGELVKSQDTPTPQSNGDPMHCSGDYSDTASEAGDLEDDSMDSDKALNLVKINMAKANKRNKNDMVTNNSANSANPLSALPMNPLAQVMGAAGTASGQQQLLLQAALASQLQASKVSVRLGLGLGFGLMRIFFGLDWKWIR